MAKDYYTVIGVPRGASQEEVKQAYRRLAREYHPDVRKDDPQANERFKEINEAYYVLGDPDRRSQYDRFGQVGDMPARDFGRDFGDLFSPFDDLLDMFLRRGAPPPPSAGRSSPRPRGPGPAASGAAGGRSFAIPAGSAVAPVAGRPPAN